LEAWATATRHAVETFHEKIEAKLFSVSRQAARKFSPPIRAIVARPVILQWCDFIMKIFEFFLFSGVRTAQFISSVACPL
jgi:hypothetical protein